MRKRVLLLSTSAGSGHVAAARALEKVFSSMPQVAEVINKDALEFTNESFRTIYSDLFLNLVKSNPQLLGWWYNESDEPWKTDTWRTMLDRVNTQPLVSFIKDYAPHIVVCTHYMPAGVVSYLMSRQELKTDLSIVTTDYDFHSMWLNRTFHRYFVALGETKAHLTALGLPENRIVVSGIPVDPQFGAPIDREQVLAKYQLDDTQPILLLSAGAVGNGPIINIIERLMQLRHRVQTIVVCGRNLELRREVEAFVLPQAERFRVIGYSTDMPSLMNIATLFIGKPGGLTSSEAMAAGLPMLVGMPIPGQEERNSDHLLEKGAAIKFNDVTVITYKIDKLLDEPERLARMREAARGLGRPNAAQVIVETLLRDDKTEPLFIDREVRRKMAEAVKGEIEPPRPVPMTAIYDVHTGVPYGLLTDAQFAEISHYLMLSGGDEPMYYVNTDTIEMLRAQGVTRPVLDVLTRAVTGHNETDICWTRR
jgi:processive 1,2-diacylglycerol beta-glucosyltransferase